jgi:LPS sulfotransferase NodH
LARTFVAGSPLEYFNPIHRNLLVERWRCPASLDAYVRALYALRTTPDGVFGAKIHWTQFVSLRAETLGISASEPEYVVSADPIDRLFPNATYVRIIRRDVNRQAISFWFALHTGTWSVAATDPYDDRPRALVPYSYEGIERCRRMIVSDELHWDRFVRSNGIEPIDVVYEDLVAGYAETVDFVLGKVVPGAEGASLTSAPTRRLSDARSEDFLARLGQDRERRGVLDPAEFLGPE